LEKFILKKIHIFAILIVTFFISIGIYNPEIRVEVSEDNINHTIAKSLNENNLIDVPSLKSKIQILNMDIQLEQDVAFIGFDAVGTRHNGSEMTIDAVAESGLYYEEGKIYLDQPWISKINDYSFNLEGKEKTAYELYKKGASFLNKFKDEEKSESKIKEKAQDYMSTMVEHIPVYSINSDKSIKNFLIEQATGDILIEENKIVAVLKPFGFY
jgi:hypothetical protein